MKAMEFLQTIFAPKLDKMIQDIQGVRGEIAGAGTKGEGLKGKIEELRISVLSGLKRLEDKIDGLERKVGNYKS